MSKHLVEAWSHRVEAWRLPETIHGYPLPRGGQFAHSKTMLDPDIFNSHNEMHPWIRGALIAMLNAFWSNQFPDWFSWTRLYLAGSLASYWWGTPDFDTLIGIDTQLFLKSNPKYRGMSEVDISKMLTQGFYTGLDPLTEHYTFPPASDTMHIVNELDERFNAGLGDSPTDKLYAQTPANIVPFGPMEVTWYVNPHSWDIRQIRPYAAYEILQGQWWVYPAIMGKEWGAEDIPLNFWEHTANLADNIKDVLALTDPVGRQEQASKLYEMIHADRSDAFSHGYGVGDLKSLRWIALNRWGLLGPLEAAIHPERGMSHVPPAIASSWRAMAPDERSQPWRDHDAVIVPEHGQTGTKRRYTTYTYGQPIATRPSLREAQEAVHEVYGPQDWKHQQLPKLTVDHQYYGKTYEFADPTHSWYVHELPRL